MAVEIAQVAQLIQRAAGCQSGMLEFPVPSVQADAVSVAVDAGYLEVIGNGMARVTGAGLEYAKARGADR